MTFRKIRYLIAVILIFTLLTILTQIGGLVLVVALLVNKKLGIKTTVAKYSVAFGLYLFATYLIVPMLAGRLGRERLLNTGGIRPTNYMTILLNRNYVRPELNQILLHTEKSLSPTGIEIRYLDASFPFFDGFPLLPHLSHKDGKKLDLSLIYQDEKGKWTNLKKSVSGYGAFEEPDTNEYNQTENCKSRGYFQYDYPKYLTFGKINSNLKYSNTGTKILLKTLLSELGIGKIFIEPHLSQRLNIQDGRIAFHGCGAVRHDDHIHIQLR